MLTPKESELEKLLKQREEEMWQKDRTFREKAASFERDKAVLQQKLEFAEVQLKETKERFQNYKRAQEESQMSSEQDGQNKIAWDKKLQELKELAYREVATKLAEYEAWKEEKNKEIGDLKDRISELEGQQSCQSCREQGTTIALLRQNMKELEDERGSLREQLAAARESSARTTSSQEDVLMEHAQEIEKLSEELLKERAAALEQRTAMSKEMEQSKQALVEERQRWQELWAEERAKHEVHLQQLAQEFEFKYSEEKLSLEDKLIELKQKFGEVEREYIQMKMELEGEVDKRNVQIKNLELLLQESKNNLFVLTSQQNQGFSQQISMLEQERKTAQDKIQILQEEVQSLDKQASGLRDIQASAQVQIARLEAEKADLTSSHCEELAKHKKEVEAVQSIVEQLQEEHANLKIQTEKDRVLAEQELIFLRQRVCELEGRLEETTSSYEKKIELQQQAGQKKFLERIGHLEDEKHSLEEKVEKYSRNVREIEVFYGKELDKLEKEKNRFSLASSTLEARVKELELQLLNENSKFLNEIKTSKENLTQEVLFYMNENEKMKTLCQQWEEKYRELHNSYQMEKGLAEEKIKFLEGQKERARNDLQDAQKKFQIALEKMQNMRECDRMENENNQKALLEAMEKRYLQKTSEQKECFEQQLEQLRQRLLQKEDEVKRSREQLQQQLQTSSGAYFQSGNNNMQQLTLTGATSGSSTNSINNTSNSYSAERERENFLLKEMDELQKEHFLRFQKLKEENERESQQLQDKLRVCENRCRELENLRNNSKRIIDDSCSSISMQSTQGGTISSTTANLSCQELKENGRSTPEFCFYPQAQSPTLHGQFYMQSASQLEQRVSQSTSKAASAQNYHHHKGFAFGGSIGDRSLLDKTNNYLNQQ